MEVSHLFEELMIDRLECDFIRCTPQTILSSNRGYKQHHFKKRRLDSVLSLKDSYVGIESDVIRENKSELCRS